MQQVIEDAARRMREAVTALERNAADAASAKGFMEAMGEALASFKDLAAYEPALPEANGTFEEAWRTVPAEVIEQNWFGFGELFVRRLVGAFRQSRDEGMRRKAAAIIKHAREQGDKQPDPPHASLVGAARPLPTEVQWTFAAAAIESDIESYEQNPNQPKMRSRIIKATRDENIQKFIANPYLWRFLAVEYCRRVSEAGFAGNRADQVENVRALTRFMRKVQEVHPPNETTLQAMIQRTLVRAMLHTDRSVGVGILELLRRTQGERTRDMMDMLRDDQERLDYVNFYFWATGYARPVQWYQVKFQKYFKLKLKHMEEKKRFALVNF